MIATELMGLGGNRDSAVIAPPWAEKVSIGLRTEGEDMTVEAGRWPGEEERQLLSGSITIVVFKYFSKICYNMVRQLSL